MFSDRYDDKLFKKWTERVRERMKELSLTQEMLAKKMEVTRGAIAHYLGGRRIPRPDQFRKLARILEVDPIWLQYGVDINKNPEMKNYLPEYDPLNPITQIPIVSWKQVAEVPDLEDIDKLTRVEYVPHLYTDELGHYALRVKGDAMTSSSGQTISFLEGDIIQVDQAAEPKHSDYVIVVLPGAKEATFRQLVIDGGVQYLKPLNPQYPMIEMDEKTRFCGVVIYHYNGKLSK